MEQVRVRAQRGAGCAHRPREEEALTNWAPRLIAFSVVSCGGLIAGGQEWTDPTLEDVRLRPSTEDSYVDDDGLGASIRVSQGRILAGAPGRHLVGGAFLFRWDAGRALWVEEQELSGPTDRDNLGGVTDAFGAACALAEDTVFVSTPLWDDGSSLPFDDNNGAVFVYRQEFGTEEWIEVQRLEENPASMDIGDWFGDSLAADAGAVLIAEPFDDLEVSQAGEAFVFRWDETKGEWLEEQRLVPSDASEGDNFGRGPDGVALRGDVAVVRGGGRRGFDTEQISGKAYVFRYDAGEGEWTEEQILESGEVEDDFAGALALEDGRVVVGAKFDDEAAEDAGAAYVFGYDAETATWVEEAKVIPSDAEAGLWFGAHVAVQGPRIAVSAYSFNLMDGAVYLFRLEDGEWVEEQKLLPSDDQGSWPSGSGFGYAVALDAGLVFVGAPSAENDSGTRTGAVYVYGTLTSGFRRGDASGDGDLLALLDALYLLSWGFTSGPEPICFDAADADDNGNVQPLLDALFILTWAFGAGEPPPDPGPDSCGSDPTSDSVDCATTPVCN